MVFRTEPQSISNQRINILLREVEIKHHTLSKGNSIFSLTESPSKWKWTFLVMTMKAKTAIKVSCTQEEYGSGRRKDAQALASKCQAHNHYDPSPWNHEGLLKFFGLLLCFFNSVSLLSPGTKATKPNLCKSTWISSTSQGFLLWLFLCFYRS